MGMVMTLIIVTPDEDAVEAMKAAQRASHEHPSRVLAVILGDARGASQVNAQVGSGDGWGGETALIRLKGEVVKHAESVVLPLLLPDSPVAIWWPTAPPADPAADPLGALAKRRITDSAGVTRGKSTAMLAQCRAYAPGNTDLSWTRLTPWRALLAAALDQHPLKVTGAVRHGRADQPQRRPARRVAGRPAQGRRHAPQLRRARASPRSRWRPRRARSPSRGPTAGWRPSPRPTDPTARSRSSAVRCPPCSSEELRRLDEDDVYARTAKRLVKLHAPTTHGSS